MMMAAEGTLFLSGRVRAATVNQHPPVHHEGWMVHGQETVFCWAPVH